MAIKLAVFDIAGTTVEDRNAVSRAFRNAFLSNVHTVSEEMINPLMGYKKLNDLYELPALILHHA